MTGSAAPAGEAEPLPPTGYRLILPPGWVRIPLRSGTAEALEDLVFSRLKELPPDVPRDQGMKYRLLVRRAVDEQIAQARAANGLDLYLPVATRHGTPLAASFLVSEVVVTGEDTVPPEVVLARLAAGDDAGTPVSSQELAGTMAVRREYVRPPAPERDVHVATRHVELALPVPYDPRRFLAVSFSTAGNGDPDSEFTTALVDLFNALMTTFRWTRHDNGRQSAAPTTELSDR